MRRKTISLATGIYLGVAALGLSSCDPPDKALSDIVTSIQMQCGYVTTYQNVANVVATMISNFNATAGAAATVVATVAAAVENAICSAVKAKMAELKPQASPEAAPLPITVTVNGVPISGYVVK
jgi:hypothetical protein